MTYLEQKYSEFYNEWNGKFIEYSDPTNPYQCMDEAGKWCEKLGIPYEAIRHLYAYEVWTKPTELTRKYFDLVPNGPKNIAPVGSLVIFDKTVGPAGHISIGTPQSNPKDLISFDQNWGNPKYCRIVAHISYKGVLGWLVPKTTLDKRQEILNQIDAQIHGGTSLDSKFSQIKFLIGQV